VAADTIVLDARALTALAGSNKRLRIASLKALRDGARVIVPTVVVAESTTDGGGRDVNVNRLLKTLLVADCDMATARSAAALRFLARAGPGTIDAIVVATADRMPGSIVLTGDPTDLSTLASVRRRSRVVDINAR
jgi:hypothetical protein